MKLFILSYCLCLFTQCFSQVTYQNLIPSGQSQYISGMIITSDDAAITYIHEAADVSHLKTLVAKVDKNGNYAWSRVYSVEDSSMEIESMVPTSNGGFLAVAYTFGTYESATYTIFRADSSGTITWKKKLAPNKPDDNFGIPTIATAKDGGFYLLYSLYPEKFYIPKTNILSKYDKAGTLKWSNPFKLDENDYGSRLTGLRELPDEKVVALFTIGSCDAYCSRLEMYSFNKNGSSGQEFRFSESVYYFGVPVFAGDEKGDIHILLYQSIDNYHSYYSYIDIKPDSNKIVAFNIDNNVYALQQFLRVNGLTMFKQQPFYAGYTAFDTNWGLIQAYSYRVNNTNNIKVDKYDSIGRICPDYTIPKASYTVIKKQMRLASYSFEMPNRSARRLTDIAVTATPRSSLNTICSGSAGESITAALTKQSMITTKAAHLAPNPANNSCVLYINGIQTESLAINITDVSGKLIMIKKELLQKGSNQINLDVRVLQSGMYFIRLQSSGIHATLKLMKR